MVAADRGVRAVVALVVAAAVVVTLNVGKLPGALPLLREEFGLDLVTASLLVTVFQLAGMLLGLFGGMLADRFGSRRMMRIGLLIAAAGSATGAMAHDVFLLLASRAIESVGFIVAVLPGPALLARHVGPQRLRGTMGLWSAYMPVGMALALVVAPFAYDTVGWRPVWGAVAAGCVAMAVALGAFVAPDPRGSLPDDALGLVRDTLSAPRAWLLAGGFFCYASQWMGVFTFLPTLYAEGGIAPSAAGALTALGVAVNMLGNLASGVLMQRGVSRAALVATGGAAMLVGAWLCFGSSAPFPVRYGGVLLFSALGGLIPGTLFASTPAYAPHPRAVGTTTGLMQQGSTFGQALAAPLIAAVASASGGWSNTWWATGALACGDLLIAWLILRTDRHAAHEPGTNRSEQARR